MVGHLNFERQEYVNPDSAIPKGAHEPEVFSAAMCLAAVRGALDHPDFSHARHVFSRYLSQVLPIDEIKGMILSALEELPHHRQKIWETFDKSLAPFPLSSSELEHFSKGNEKLKVAYLKAILSGDCIHEKISGPFKWFSENIENFQISDENDRIDLVKIMMGNSVGVGYALQSFSKYKITDPGALFEIAKLGARQNGYVTSELIQSYGITDKDFLIEVAKLAASQDGGGTSRYIQSYGIDSSNQKALIEIAKLAAQQAGGGTSLHIQKYGIDVSNQKALIEIAKLAAQQNGWGISESIQNYRIDALNQEALIEIAKLAAQQAGGGTSLYIQKYGIDASNQKALIEIAKLAASQDGGGTSSFIQNYAIEIPQILIEIAKLAASQDGGGTSEFIQNYGIEDPQVLIEIAKLAASQDGGGTSEFIQNYGIEDPQVLIEIAKLAASQDGAGTSEFIQNYAIEDPRVLIEIAKLAVQQNADETSEFIQNYSIPDQLARAELAQLAAKQSGGGISKFIENYRLEDEQVRVEVAKLAAQQQGEGTSYAIGNYNIENEDSLIEIAKLAASQDGRGTSAYIQNYGIKNEKALGYIALVCARQPGGLTPSLLHNYQLRDVALCGKLLPFAWGQESVLQPLSDEKKQLLQLDWQQVGSYLICNGLEDQVAKLAHFLDFSLLEASMNGVWAKIDKTPVSPAKEEKKLTYAKVCLSLQLTGLSLDQVQAVFKILESLLELRSGDLRQALTASLLALLDQPELINLWVEVTEKKNKCSHLSAVLLLSCLKEMNVAARLDWINVLAADRDGDRLQSRVRCLLSLTQHLHLSTQQKQELLSSFVFIKTQREDEKIEEQAHRALRSLQMLTQLLAFGEFERLLALLETRPRSSLLEPTLSPTGSQQVARFFSTKSEELEKELEKVMQSIFQLQRPGLTDKYLETFGRFRQPEAIVRYAAGLRTLGNENSMACLSRYVKGVCLGTFKEERYATADNPHLLHLFEKKPELKEKWPINSRIALKLDESVQVASRPDVRGILQKGIFQHGHLQILEPKCQLLFAFFQDPQKETEIRKQLASELSPINDFQLDLIEVCSKIEQSSADAQIESFKKLQNSLKRLNGTPIAFESDIDLILDSLKKFKEAKPSLFEGWTVENTDDPCDLLLIGTEVKGSCQNIGGSPSLNQGLLAYLLDGKNRAVVIKNARGQIQARCILRILWDELHQVPILFQETIYPERSTLDPRLSQALTKACRAKSQELEIPLLASEGTKPYVGRVLSKKGPVPFEYVDAVKGLKANGIFEVMQAYWVERGT